jgi:hypothetical protein
MPNNNYILRSDALKAILGVSIYDTIEELEGARTIAENTWADGLYDAYKIIEEEVDAADVEPKQRWIQVADDSLPDEGEEVLVYDGCYRIAKIEKGISVNERERMKRGEIPDPEEWGWNVAEGYFRVRRSESYKACDEQGNNEKPYCWRADNGRGTLFGQNVKYWMPLPEPPKEEKEEPHD